MLHLHEILQTIDRGYSYSDNLVCVIAGALYVYNRPLYNQWKNVRFNIDCLFLEDIYNTPRSLLHIASEKNFINLAVLLLNCTTPKYVNVLDYNINTPLHYAVAHNHQPMIMLLLSRGAYINAINYFLSTPLHEAANGHHAEAIRLLLKNGADHTKKNIYYQTPCDVSLSYNVDIHNSHPGLMQCASPPEVIDCDIQELSHTTYTHPSTGITDATTSICQIMLHNKLYIPANPYTSIDSPMISPVCNKRFISTSSESYWTASN